MKPFVCVYGSGGSGKTTMCSGIPNALYIDTEKRAQVPDKVTVGCFKDFKNALKNIGDKKRVIIDSLDVLDQHIEKHIRDTFQDQPLSEQYRLRRGLLTEVFLTLRDMDITVIATASVVQGIVTELDVDTGKEVKIITLEPYLSGGKTGAMACVEKHFDVIAYLDREKTAKDVRIGGTRGVIMANGKTRSLVMDEELGGVLTKNVLSDVKRLTADKPEELQERFLEFIENMEARLK